MCKPKVLSPDFFGNLPADAGNQWLGPHLRDNKERLYSRFGFHVMVAGHHVVSFPVVLWVQSINLVGCLDYFSGHQTWLTGAKTIHGITEAAVCIVGTYVVIFMAAVWGGTSRAVPGN